MFSEIDTAERRDLVRSRCVVSGLGTKVRLAVNGHVAVMPSEQTAPYRGIVGSISKVVRFLIVG